MPTLRQAFEASATVSYFLRHWIWGSIHLYHLSARHSTPWPEQSESRLPATKLPQSLKMASGKLVSWTLPQKKHHPTFPPGANRTLRETHKATTTQNSPKWLLAGWSPGLFAKGKRETHKPQPPGIPPNGLWLVGLLDFSLRETGKPTNHNHPEFPQMAFGWLVSWTFC